MLSGNSIHVGVGYRRFRLDLDNFAIAIPAWIHGNDGFDASFDGYGAKLQVFPFDEQRGLFAGIDGGWSRVWIQRKGADLAVRKHQLGVGVHIGDRIAVIDRVYGTPWIGVGHQLDPRDIMRATGVRARSPVSVRFGGSSGSSLPVMHSSHGSIAVREMRPAPARRTRRTL